MEHSGDADIDIPLDLPVSRRHPVALWWIRPSSTDIYQSTALLLLLDLALLDAEFFWTTTGNVS